MLWNDTKKIGDLAMQILFVNINSQVPARKSNPQAPVSPCAAISVKARSYSSKISTKVFVGAENP